MKRKPGEDKAPSSAETAKILPPKEGVEALSPTPTHPIKLPTGLLSLVALQLQTSSAGGLKIEEFFPRAYQLLCEEKKFLGGTEPPELAHIETNGRRWEAGEGFDYSKVPPVPELKFDPSPAKLEESCKHLRSQFEGIKLARRNKTLAEHVGECHKAIHRALERRKELLHARGEEDAGGVAAQSYEAFAGPGALIFVGWQVGVLVEYLALRRNRVGPKRAEESVWARRYRET